MSREEILRKVNEIFWDVFDDESIVVTEETTAADIEDWDSLTHITLISEVEGEFGFTFAMKDVLGMKNVGEMLDIIMKSAKL
ncbi:MAG: phosphopantetheine-binding protein [Lachnospiraceae bacterium]|nr:phosphopantetheine-binding protein [Lachnospiraceae bacterium]